MVKLNTEMVPPLRDGDRLSGEEYWRRYLASAEGTRAELLDGVVYLHRRGEESLFPEDEFMAPASDGLHCEPQLTLGSFLHQYATFTTGTRASLQPTLLLPNSETKPEPDSLLRVLPECGGRSWHDAEGWLHGVPDLLCEVANSSARIDLGVKYDNYEANGVAEYIVWRTAAGLFDWFVLKRKKYVSLTPDPADGYLKSVAFPGLWLDVAALLAGDGRTVLAVLQKGLATPEHAAFEAKLAATAAKKAKPKKRK